MRWIVGLLMVAQAAAAQDLPAHQVNRDFGQALYREAELTGGRPEAWARIEATAVVALQDLRDDTFTLTDDKGRTALMVASAEGHWPLVETLLARGADVAGVGLRDGQGLDAADHARLAQRHMFYACAPVIENPFVLVPLLVKLPYYEYRTPYPRIRDALIAAGAPAAPDIARNFWLDRCSNPDPTARSRVAHAEDLIATLAEISQQVQLEARRAAVAAQTEVLQPWLDKQTAEDQARIIADMYRNEGLDPPPFETQKD